MVRARITLVLQIPVHRSELTTNWCLYHLYNNPDRYNEWADMRSWESAYHFVQEAFGEISFESQPPAGINVAAVEYSDGEASLRGYLAMPSKEWMRPLPAVVIIPDWNGVNEYEQERATLLAEQGYVAMAADIFGADLQQNLTMNQRIELSSMYRDDNPESFVRRMQLAIDQVKMVSDVDDNEIALIGYCFGGSGVVYYGMYGGDDAKVAVAFHGSFNGLPSAVEEVTPYLLL